MIEFILNNAHIITESLQTTVLLDFIRKEKKLTGTKEGCREGDCGACTVLVGSLIRNNVVYKSVNSCLVPLGDINGKHVVTVEGFNQAELSPVQSAIADEGGTQCGFCTPGFVVSMTGYFLSNSSFNSSNAVESLGGNICRCTGYAGIKRAAEIGILTYEENKSQKKTHLENLIALKFVPGYFSTIKDRLRNLNSDLFKKVRQSETKTLIAGGTDLYVQRWESLVRGQAELLSGKKNLTGISIEDKQIKIGAYTTIEEIKSSELLQKYFNHWNYYLNLFGSLPIRNRATIGGNIVNASPIGDMTNLLLALDATVHLTDGDKNRQILLRSFYIGYKTLEKKKHEIVEAVSFPIPARNFLFNYEKVSKRIYLDIASVNSSIYLEMKNGKIFIIRISAGGVAPVPFFLKQTCSFLLKKEITTETIIEAGEITQKEINPISDARGSAEYKRLLLRQLFYAHFIKLFPQQIELEKLF
ncbi:MAG: FAD binding domain-containing protein [Ignavibacteriales bacterium]|nr:FAD binding domain-containing protein [Ignavibacteriales bacterium]